MPHGLGFAQDDDDDLARHSVGATVEASRDPLPEGNKMFQHPGSLSGQGFQLGAQTGTEFAYPEEEDKGEHCGSSSAR